MSGGRSPARPPAPRRRGGTLVPGRAFSPRVQPRPMHQWPRPRAQGSPRSRVPPRSGEGPVARREGGGPIGRWHVGSRPASQAGRGFSRPGVQPGWPKAIMPLVASAVTSLVSKPFSGQQRQRHYVCHCRMQRGHQNGFKPWSKPGSWCHSNASAVGSGTSHVRLISHRLARSFLTHKFRGRLSTF
jgi:hypothetical protein